MNRRALVRASVVAAIAVLASGCAAVPDRLDLSTEKLSEAGQYRVALLPPAEPPAINRIHSWKLRLTTPDGTPVSGAHFGVGGGMPQHGHGLPTKPRVTAEVGDGVYLVEGMKFSMPGWWQLEFDIRSQRKPDKVTFNTVVSAVAGRN